MKRTALPIPNVIVCLALCAGLALCTGCESGLKNVKLPGIPTAEELEAETDKAEQERQRYRTEHDPQAIRWLLANRVRQGMTLEQVNRILGEDGQRLYNDAHLKNRTTGTRLTDVTYQWGPDSDGQVYVLFFRNDRLLNFNPGDYE